MEKFIQQFRKAKESGKRLIWDGTNERYLITDKKHWQNWYGCKLIKNFGT